jgi:hypothetical protein
MVVTADGNMYGDCIVFPKGGYACFNHNGVENRHGYRNFRDLNALDGG